MLCAYRGVLLEAPRPPRRCSCHRGLVSLEFPLGRSPKHSSVDSEACAAAKFGFDLGGARQRLDVRYSSIRADLLKIAEHYEVMARHVERLRA